MKTKNNVNNNVDNIEDKIAFCSNTENTAMCTFCRGDEPYEVIERLETVYHRGILCQYIRKYPLCLKCGNEVSVLKISDENLEAMKKAYEEAVEDYKESEQYKQGPAAAEAREELRQWRSNNFKKALTALEKNKQKRKEEAQREKDKENIQKKIKRDKKKGIDPWE